jgi:urea transport system substrate-binding protein
MEFDAPGGKKKMHESNQHTYKPVYIGEIMNDGQFKIVWDSKGLVEPDSYSKLLHTPEELAAMRPTGGPKR